MEAIVPIGYLVNKGADITVIGPKKVGLKLITTTMNLLLRTKWERLA